MHTQKHTLIPLCIVTTILFSALNFSISVQGMKRESRMVAKEIELFVKKNGESRLMEYMIKYFAG